jgi:hypothetical protein
LRPLNKAPDQATLNKLPAAFKEEGFLVDLLIITFPYIEDGYPLPHVSEF